MVVRDCGRVIDVTAAVGPSFQIAPPGVRITGAAERLADAAAFAGGLENVGGVRSPGTFTPRWALPVVLRSRSTTAIRRQGTRAAIKSLPDGSHRTARRCSAMRTPLAFEWRPAVASDRCPGAAAGRHDTGIRQDGRSVHRGVRVDVYERKQAQGAARSCGWTRRAGSPRTWRSTSRPDGVERQAADLDVTANVPPRRTFRRLIPRGLCGDASRPRTAGGARGQ